MDFPSWVDPQVRTALANRGIGALWHHQAIAADLLRAGTSVAIATPTASGKTLAYLLPIIAATWPGGSGERPMGARAANTLGMGHVPSAGEDLGSGTPAASLLARRRQGAAAKLGLTSTGTSLYLAPTKALAHDQLAKARELELPGWRVCTLDGDSEPGERRFAQDHAHHVLSNPDMLHRSVLPNHPRWARLLGGLRYVVLDEAHRYRGVFGAHVSAVLRRLRRLAQHYGADPVFVTVSATMAEADTFAALLTGLPHVAVTEDTSARPALDFGLWQGDDDPSHDAAKLLTRLVRDGRQTLAFTSSRVQAELIALRAQETLGAATPVAAYRGGYLADDRRDLEARLRSGELRGVACTNALELGVDIDGMDAVLTCGFPGTLAALWQQAGRAGRRGRDALALLIARADPLDTYLCAHPELIFDAPVERAVLHPENPLVLGPHVAAAAQELPITLEDERWFGPTMPGLLASLERQGVLRRRAAGWHWTHPLRAVDAIDLRSMGRRSVDVIDEETGRVIGLVDPSAADRTLHEGAVYLHQGEQWLVDSYQPEESAALAQRVEVTYFTQPLAASDVRILDTTITVPFGRAELSHGPIESTSQVIGYLRRDANSGDVWDRTPLDLPPRTMTTHAVWLTLPADALRELQCDDLAGAAHAAEHTAIGLLPAFAPCDRWDIGGLSTVLHPDTGRLTVFVIDGQPGGAGFAECGFEQATAWWRATRDRLLECPCEEGCPRCVVSPKCGNGNSPLDKVGALRMVELLVGVTGEPPGSPPLPTP